MQETPLKVNREPKTIVAVSVASEKLSESWIMLSTFQKVQMVQREQQIVIYTDEASMASGNGNRDSLNPIIAPSVVEKASDVLVP